MDRLSKNEEKMKEMLNSQQFEYNPQHWEAAEKMLPKKGILGLKVKAIWFTLPILIVSAGLNYWLSPETTLDNQTAINQNQQSKTIVNDDNIQLEKSAIENINQNSGKESVANTENNSKAGSNTNETVTNLTSKTINTEDSKPKDKQNYVAVNSVTPIAKEKASNKADKRPITKDKPENILTKNNEKTLPNVDATNTEQKAERIVKESNNKTSVALDNEANIKDEAKKEEKQNKAEEPKQIFLKNSISIVVAANYSRLIQPFGNSYISAPYFGIQYQKILSPKWQLNTGLAYTSVNADALSKVYNKEQYSFGLNKEQINITTNKLHYIELPVIAKYKALNSFSIVAGANLSYLLNTNNTLETSSSSTLGGNTFSQTNSNQYRKGINSFDVQMQFGIEYKLNTNLHFGVLANSGLMDVSKNNYYNSEVFNRNSRLQLYLKYDFIRF